MPKKFSVVIPLFNKGEYIYETINSVLSQLFENFELIVINDGSTDNGLSVVEAIFDDRLRVYTIENSGVSYARNYGIKKADGEYIAFLDADDQWEDNYLLLMNALIRKYPQCDMYGAAYKRVTKSNVLAVGDHLCEGVVVDFFRTKLDCNINWTSATIVKTKVILETGGFPVGMIGGEDDYTWSKIAKNSKVAFTPKVLAKYNFRYGALTERIGRPDSCHESWFDLYDRDRYYLNEFIAQKAIISGIRHALGGHKFQSRKIEEQFRYTHLSKQKWMRLVLFNRMPLMLLKFLNRYLTGRLRGL